MTDLTVTIASGAALSPAIDLSYAGNKIRPRLFRLNMPAEWTAAGLSFAVCETLDGTYLPLYQDVSGTLTEYTLPTGAGVSLLLEPADFASIQFLKIRSGTVGTPVNQAAARTLGLVTREI